MSPRELCAGCALAVRPTLRTGLLAAAPLQKRSAALRGAGRSPVQSPACAGSLFAPRAFAFHLQVRTHCHPVMTNGQLLAAPRHLQQGQILSKRGAEQCRSLGYQPPPATPGCSMSEQSEDCLEGH